MDKSINPNAPVGIDQNIPATDPTIMILFMVFYIIFLILVFVSFWKVYVKAGRKGWEGLVPFYNIYVLMGIVGRPGWWFILYFIPIVNLIITIIIAIDLARSFGKSAFFGIIWLWLLGIFGYLYLAFSKAKYIGPSVKPAIQPTPKPEATPPAPPPAQK